MSSKRRNQPRRRARTQPLADAAGEMLPVSVAPPDQWWLAAAVVFALAVVAYWPTLGNGLINWDDHEYLTENDYVAESGGLARIWNPSEEHRQFYPMVFSSYWLEHKVALWLRGQTAKVSYQDVDPLERGFEPRIHHLTNLVLHATCAALVVWLLRLLGLSPWVAFLTAALLAVHPINVASVAWAAERKNVLSGVFYLLCLICYVQNVRRGGVVSYGLCLVCFALALLSKSATVTLPAIALLCDRLVRRRWVRTSLAKVAPMLPLAAISVYLTVTIETANAGANLVPLDPVLRPLAAAGAVWFYLGKLVVPWHLAGVYARWDVVGRWPLFLAAAVALAAAGWLVWKRRRRIPAQAWWGLGQFVITLTPMLGLVAFNYTRYSFVANHFIYLPSIGVFLCVALAVDSVRRRAGAAKQAASAATVLASVVVLTLAAASFHQCRTVWKDGETFWTHTLALTPNCWAGHYNLANLYKGRADELADANLLARQQAAQAESVAERTQLLAKAEAFARERSELLEKAAAGFQRAGEAKATFTRGYGARGDVLTLLGRPEEAIEEYRTALQLEPTHAIARTKLAGLLLASGAADEAIEHYELAVQQQPSFSAAHTNLGKALYEQGRIEEAVERLKEALKLDPESSAAHNQLGLALRRQGKAEEAFGHYQRALELDPMSAEAHTNLALLLVRMGQVDVAAEGFEHVLKLRPGFRQALIGLGLARAGQGRTEEAIEHFRGALRINPRDVAAHTLLADQFMRLGSLEQAVAEYREALRLDPDYSSARRGLEQALGNEQQP